MTTADGQTDTTTDVGDMRERLLSAAEFACTAWVVIGHNVLHIFPNEVPILAVIALVSARLMRGGFQALGFRRPASWRTVVLLAVAFVVVRFAVGMTIEALTAHSSLAIAGAKGSDRIPGNLGAALATLGIVWTFAAFGEEIGYRGYIHDRVAVALGGGRLAWGLALVASAVLFGLGHFYKGPAGVLDSGIAGLLLGGVYLLSGRCLWTCILAHGLSDTAALTLAYFGLTS